MKDKTDISKNVRRTRCDPFLTELFQIVNSFPPLKLMKDLDLPPIPMDRRKLFRGELTQERDEQLDKELAADERRFKQQSFFVLMRLLEQLFKTGFPAAALIIAPANEQEAAFQTLREYKASRHSFDENVTSEVWNDLEMRQAAIAGMDAAQKSYADTLSLYSARWATRYRQIRSIKSLLTKLAFVGRNLDAANRTIHYTGKGDLDHLIPKLVVDDEGILSRKVDPVEEKLIGIDVRRIRQCSVCHGLFWAQRIDRQCCQKKCADAYNQRLSRERKRSHGDQYRKAADKKRQGRVSDLS